MEYKTIKNDSNSDSIKSNSINYYNLSLNKRHNKSYWDLPIINSISNIKHQGTSISKVRNIK